MNPMKISGANGNLGAPNGWDAASRGECKRLSVRMNPPLADLMDGRQANVEYTESAWKPTPEELEMLNSGGAVILRVAGWQVPVCLYADPAEAGHEEVAA